MPNRSSSAARIHEPPDHDVHASQTARAPFDPLEAEFFRRGDAGLIEPPVFLPMDSLAFPLVGVGFLAVLTLLLHC